MSRVESERHSFSVWLSLILDTSKPLASKTLEEMSNFMNNDYHSVKSKINYAIQWCNLSNFLFRHRDKQLRAYKFEMMFEIPESTSYTNLYWFEVIRACEIASFAFLAELVNKLKLTTGTTDESFASSCMQLSMSTREAFQLSLLSVIGCCNYVITEVTHNCIYAEQCSPLALADIKRRHHAMRIIGTWLVGMHHWKDKENYKEAADWFFTCDMLAQGSPDLATGAIQPLCGTALLFKQMCLIEMEIKARERDRASERCRELTKWANGKHANIIQELTTQANSSASFSLGIPDSRLLHVLHVFHRESFLRGTDPLKIKCGFSLLLPSDKQKEAPKGK